MQWLDEAGESGERIKRESEVVFGEQVRLNRNYWGLTQRALSEKLATEWGVRLDVSAITRIERGQRPVRLHEAIGLAYVLDAESFDLFMDQTMPTSSVESIESLKRSINQQIAELDDLKVRENMVRSLLRGNREILAAAERQLKRQAGEDVGDE